MHSNVLRAFTGIVSKNELRSEHCATVKIKFPTFPYKLLSAWTCWPFLFRKALFLLWGSFHQLIFYSSVHLLLSLSKFGIHLAESSSWFMLVDKCNCAKKNCFQFEYTFYFPLQEDGFVGWGSSVHGPWLRWEAEGGGSGLCLPRQRWLHFQQCHQAHWFWDLCSIWKLHLQPGRPQHGWI